MNWISVICAAMITVLLTGGCAVDYIVPMQQARKMINNGNAECVVIKDGKIAAHKRGGGISPLLAFYDESPELLKGNVVVDKVVGRAAAFIAIAAGVSHIHGEVMSSDAESLLTKHNISSSHNELVPKILNRKRNGLCPLEKSVSGTEDPAEAIKNMRKAIEAMSKAGEK